MAEPIHLILARHGHSKANAAYDADSMAVRQVVIEPLAVGGVFVTLTL